MRSQTDYFVSVQNFANSDTDLWRLLSFLNGNLSGFYPALGYLTAGERLGYCCITFASDINLITALSYSDASHILLPSVYTIETRANKCWELRDIFWTELPWNGRPLRYPGMKSVPPVKIGQLTDKVPRCRTTGFLDPSATDMRHLDLRV